MEAKSKTLCHACFSSLQLLSSFQRCRRCFHPLFEERHRCAPSFLTRYASCFDDSPQVRALLSTSPSALSSFAILQMHHLRWPIPNLIIPTPGDWFSTGDDRWETRKEIAKTIATFLNRPCLLSLHLERHLLLTPYLSLENQDGTVDHQAVHVQSKEKIVNVNILLVHDIFRSGKALQTSALSLLSSGALNVWGISIIGDHD